MKDQTTKVSKFLSLVLRHQPEKIGISLGSQGWVPVSDLLQAMEKHGMSLSFEELEHVVRSNDKKRFSFSDDGKLIRASQGHSVEIDLGYEPAVPPAVLYHGTAERFLESIQLEGLVKGKRHHVHLSESPETAIAVGQRYGKPIVLTIQSARMHEDGHRFFRSANGVWLTDQVPVGYLVK
jgi:putative RNA 2'-phosphotransferase